MPRRSCRAFSPSPRTLATPDPRALAVQRPGAGEQPQLAVQRAGRDAGQAGDLAHVVALARVQEQERQRMVTVRAEQQVGDVGPRRQSAQTIRSQHSYDCSSLENNGTGEELLPPRLAVVLDWARNSLGGR